jgi:aspartate racemase
MLTNDSSDLRSRRPAGRDGVHLLGVLGGLGPLASAEFLKTIYERHPGGCEQSLPRVVLYSDPTFPDRTESLLNGSQEVLLERLTDTLGRLYGLGVSHVAICCITMHHLLSHLPSELKEKIISLVEIILEETIRKRQRQLLMCTTGSRNLGVFQSHHLWERARDFIVLPDEADQQRIHSMIYEVKRGESIDSLLPALEALLAKYRVESFIAGCTEMHLLSKRVSAGGAATRRYDCVDPLISIAQSLCRAGDSPSLGDAAAGLDETPQPRATGDGGEPPALVFTDALLPTNDFKVPR